MSQIFCAGCGRKMEVPNWALGVRVRCPTCGFEFTAPAAAQVSAGNALDDLASAVESRQQRTTPLSPQRKSSPPLALSLVPPPAQQKLTIKGGLATVFFACLWLSVADAPGRIPAFAFILSSIVVAFTLTYLAAPSVRQSVDRALTNVRPGFRLPSVRLLIICGFGALVGGAHVVSRMHTNSEVSRLIVSAKDAHANGDPERAVELLSKASLKFDADDREEADDLLTQYEKELGRKQEAQVARLIATAREAMATGDSARAMSLLTQAKQFYNAPNWTEADELLKQLEPPERPGGGQSNGFARGGDSKPDETAQDDALTMGNYLRITVEAVRWTPQDREAAQDRASSETRYPLLRAEL